MGAAKGFDFASTNVSVGYEMGRLKPFMTAGVALAKPDVIGRGFTTPCDAFNDLFDSTASVKAYGSVGGGFDFAVTDKLIRERHGFRQRGAWPGGAVNAASLSLEALIGLAAGGQETTARRK